MDFARPITFSATGSVPLLNDEIVRKIQPNVDVYIGSAKSDEHRRGVVTVTTHRLFWVTPDSKRGHQWSLSQIADVQHESGGLFVGSFHIVLTIGPLPKPGPPSPSPASTGKIIKLSFKSGGRDEFSAEIRTALSRKSWVVEAPVDPLARTEPKEFNTRAAGYAGIMARLEEARGKEAALASQAFSGMTELMNNAKQIVKMAESYATRVSAASQRAATLAAAAGSSPEAMAGTPSSEAPSKEEGEAFTSVLRQIGLTSPVTRAVAGALYNQELARQIAEFIRPRLEAKGGMMTLTDVYCLYNRARGTDLVSPDDMLEACKLLGSAGYGMQIQELSSGVKLLQLDSYRSEAMTKRLLDLLRDREYLTPVEVARVCNLPLPVAQQLLEAAEQRLSLCRDDTIRGLRFYPNRFM